MSLGNFSIFSINCSYMYISNLVLRSIYYNLLLFTNLLNIHGRFSFDYCTLFVFEYKIIYKKNNIEVNIHV